MYKIGKDAVKFGDVTGIDKNAPVGSLSCVECGKVALYHSRRKGYCSAHREVLVNYLRKHPWNPWWAVRIANAEIFNRPVREY